MRVSAASGKVMKLYQSYARKLPGSYTTRVPAALGKAIYQRYAWKLLESYTTSIPAASGKAADTFKIFILIQCKPKLPLQV